MDKRGLAALYFPLLCQIEWASSATCRILDFGVHIAYVTVTKPYRYLTMWVTMNLAMQCPARLQAAASHLLRGKRIRTPVILATAAVMG